jgi:hypothetical protein
MSRPFRDRFRIQNIGNSQRLSKNTTCTVSGQSENMRGVREYQESQGI